MTASFQQTINISYSMLIHLGFNTVKIQWPPRFTGRFSVWHSRWFRYPLSKSSNHQHNLNLFLLKVLLREHKFRTYFTCNTSSLGLPSDDRPHYTLVSIHYLKKLTSLYQKTLWVKHLRIQQFSNSKFWMKKTKQTKTQKKNEKKKNGGRWLSKVRFVVYTISWWLLNSRKKNTLTVNIITPPRSNSLKIAEWIVYLKESLIRIETIKIQYSRWQFQTKD